MKFYKKSNSFRESYIDTLGKLYDYSTIRYANNRVSKVIDTDKEYTYAGFKAQCDSPVQTAHTIRNRSLG